MGTEEASKASLPPSDVMRSNPADPTNLNGSTPDPTTTGLISGPLLKIHLRPRVTKLPACKLPIEPMWMKYGGAMNQVGDDYDHRRRLRPAVPAVCCGLGQRLVALRMHLSGAAFVSFRPPVAKEQAAAWATTEFAAQGLIMPA